MLLRGRVTWVSEPLGARVVALRRYFARGISTAVVLAAFQLSAARLTW